MDKIIQFNEKFFLKGELQSYPLTGSEDKFTPKGKIRFWPGCTIICKISLNSKLHQAITVLQSQIMKIVPSDAYTFLPPSSFHITLFDCCNVSTMNTPFWPKDISSTDDYGNVTNLLKKRLNGNNFPNIFNLKLTKLFGGFSLLLEGFTHEDERLLRETRDKLSNLLGIKFPTHDTYNFHISLGYLLRWLSKNETQIKIKESHRLFEEFNEKIPLIVMKSPELCTFENMHVFISLNKIS